MDKTVKFKSAQDLPDLVRALEHPDSPADSADPVWEAERVPTESACNTWIRDVSASQPQMRKPDEWKPAARLPRCL
jgi:hypothetical protein